MVKEAISRFRKINIPGEHKEEFKRELVEVNLLRGKVLGATLIIVELIVIAYSIASSPNTIMSKPKSYYYIMYIVMILVMTVILLLINSLSKKVQRNIKILNGFTYGGVAFVVSWNMVITLLDQMSSGTLLSYFIALVGASVIIYMRPRAILIIYASIQMCFMVLLPMFQKNGVSPFGAYINTTIAAIVSCFLGYIIYKNKAVDFSQRKIIEQKNKQLEELNRKLRQSNKTLDYMSKTDGLTGIYNRRMFNNISQCFWSKCRSNNLSLTTIMMDIDYFKEYNDNYGHQAGDECLMKLVDTISNTMKQYSDKEQSILARYGGEEFILLVCNLTCEKSYELSESIRTNVEKLNIERKHREVADHITLSLGVYCGSPITDVSSNIAEYVGNADKALYTAKKSGRNVTKVFS